ncbi:MAG: LysR family transcriptional regulator [Geminicoccaceae bacterium]|nr:LysR family transcriptional regulator [Geminicoccaceae bacterium]
MDWDNARLLLAVGREGQILGAARKLGISQAKLSRRIAALESATGQRLLDRTTRGSILTEAGQTLFAAAERAETGFLGALSQIGQQEDLAGTVRIGAPDGFGSHFLAPRIGMLAAEFPNLSIELVPVPRSFSLAEREADIAIMVGRPGTGRLRVRRLTDYTLGLYASSGYLTRAGMPGEIDDLLHHDLVGYVDDLIYSPELNYAVEVLPGWRSRIGLATAVGQIEAVAAGAGIGILHDFMVAGRNDLVPILTNIRIKRAYWTAWHENLRTARRVQAVANFLQHVVWENRELFSETRQPG